MEIDRSLGVHGCHQSKPCILVSSVLPEDVVGSLDRVACVKTGIQFLCSKTHPFLDGHTDKVEDVGIFGIPLGGQRFTEYFLTFFFEIMVYFVLSFIRFVGSISIELLV